MKEEIFHYDDKIVRWFLWATVFWGLIGTVAGVFIAFQLYYPVLNFDLPWLTFGRLRPLHTNAVIFAFCGNAIFAGIYHSSQRLLKARMWSDSLSQVHFWGWQLIIVLAAITLPLGLTSTKEYAELEWPIDIAITLVWVVFAINYFMTLKVRREKVLYVSIWFYIATIVTIALLHVVNSLAVPVTPLKSYSIYSGVKDALVQWWYGHNAVAFFLTTPFLGLAYYYIPKALNKPIYSYRLSIIHFWSLIFIYIWAGPHHLQYTALPEWLQSLGAVFSIMLIAPSWGGAINFIMTIRMAWDKVRTEPIIKFFFMAATFYMMATFEGPMLSIKYLNRFTHYTDWIPAHVHVGALGWNGYIIFGMAYFLVPVLYKTKIYSKKLMNFHFWISIIGIAMYALSMWTAGLTTGLMREVVSEGALKYANYMEMVNAILPLHLVRAVGGSLYVLGIVVMIYNLLKTIQSAPKGALADSQGSAVPYDKVAHSQKNFGAFTKAAENWGSLMIIGSFAAVSVGGVLELVPMFALDRSQFQEKYVKPYTPLELEGRDIYIREGCNNCHSQMVRPILAEKLRYGEPTSAGEHVYEFPHLWGSKRTGPDLQRLGKKYGDLWHWKHMIRPDSISVGSIMPNYPWLAEDKLDTSDTQQKIKVMKLLGVPYSHREVDNALTHLRSQAEKIAKNLREQGADARADVELIALIAYLQRLGLDRKQAESGKEIH